MADLPNSSSMRISWLYLAIRSVRQAEPVFIKPVFKATARNFNEVMAMAGRITIAEVEELVEPGQLDPNFIHVPGIFVQRIFQGTHYEKRIEQKTVRQKPQ